MLLMVVSDVIGGPSKNVAAILFIHVPYDLKFH